MHSEGQAGKGKAHSAAWRGRNNRVEGVNLGRNRALARGRNRNSRPEQQGLETVRVGVSGRQPIDPLPCLSLAARPPVSQYLYQYQKALALSVCRLLITRFCTGCIWERHPLAQVDSGVNQHAHIPS